MLKYQMTCQEIADQTQVQVAVTLKCNRTMNWQSLLRGGGNLSNFFKFDIVHLINVAVKNVALHSTVNGVANALKRHQVKNMAFLLS